jgi:hypothetical protein
MEKESINKIKILHAEKFGIENAETDFIPLIDRLQKHSEWKFPDRKWTIDTYYGIAFEWIGKEKELEKRVLKLEAEMNNTLNATT